jgi:plasmid maintenance system antidote protein VapI
MGKNKKTQVKLAGKIGVCPLHLSEVKRGIANLGGNAAKRAAKTLGTGIEIWLAGPTKADIKARAKAINDWCV